MNNMNIFTMWCRTVWELILVVNFIITQPESVSDRITKESRSSWQIAAIERIIIQYILTLQEDTNAVAHVSDSDCLQHGSSEPGEAHQSGDSVHQGESAEDKPLKSYSLSIPTPKCSQHFHTIDPHWNPNPFSSVETRRTHTLTHSHTHHTHLFTHSIIKCVNVHGPLEHILFSTAPGLTKEGTFYLQGPRWPESHSARYNP